MLKYNEMRIIGKINTDRKITKNWRKKKWRTSRLDPFIFSRLEVVIVDSIAKSCCLLDMIRCETNKKLLVLWQNNTGKRNVTDSGQQRLMNSMLHSFDGHIQNLAGLMCTWAQNLEYRTWMINMKSSILTVWCEKIS